ncbi:CHAT domain-containing tetratricopeptide repeat protein [Aquimarina sp. AU474]|uniref:CHAT domain-containing protein n=1 Tax=Aquimarina sp. AU474 TaxID=2108529 RepID=UPI001F1BC87E|nr:CHAT domain-containing tetratricopeptide repeat protein [Aquimarina sp. AU474]
MKHRKRLFISILFLCFWQSIKAQNAYEYYMSLFNSDTIKISEIRKAVDSIIDIYDKNDEQLKIVKIARHFAIKNYNKKLYHEAISYVKKEISIYEKLDMQNNKYAKALYNLGLLHSKAGAYEESFIYHKKVIAQDKDEYSTAKSYCEIGKYYRQVGDFFKSKDYYSRGIYLLEKLDKKQLLVIKYLDFSQVLRGMGTEYSLDQQLTILDKANTLFNEAPSYSFYGLRNYFRMNNAYANYYNSYTRFNFNKAKEYYYKNLEKAIEIKDSAAAKTLYTNLGNLYIESKNELQKDSTVYFLNEGLKYCAGKEEEANIYYNFSNYYLVKKKHLKALDHIQKSIARSIRIDNNIEALPGLNDLTVSDKKYSVLLALIQKATILIGFYQEENDRKHIELALSNLLVADTLVDILLNISEEEGSRLYWREKASEIYLKGILICEILDEKEKAFYFSEKKKALLLTEDILKNTDKTRLPLEISNRENELKKQILDIENRITNQKNKDSIAVLNSKRFELKQQYQEQKDSLQIQFPGYYKEKETTKIIDLHKIQETLNNDRVIISYVGNQDQDDDSFSVLYAVLISNTQTEIIRVGELKMIEELIKTYRNQLSKPFETNEDRLSYQKVAYKLYNLLIPRDKISIPLDEKHLIIIPDGTLQYIPFESLITDKDTYRYLIEENEISYAYSMSFLEHNATLMRTPSENAVTFAPIHFMHSDLEDITNSIDEINGIDNYISSSHYKRQEASKQNFLSNTQNHKIIHLATHANFSDKLQIAFHDANLEYHELYTSKNQAELVVLSACNTSLGEIAKGEGVMSLARGFFYAGANTVISTFWNANDKSTATIMDNFYKNLKAGQTKSKALHNSKIEYLRSNSLSDASPYYWATFVLIGDSETILFPTKIFFYGVILFFFLVLIISFLTYYFRKR